jgi:hypothetical protein
MKIYLNHARNDGDKPTKPLTRLAILCGAAWMCVASATAVHAQSKSESLRQAGGFSSVISDVQDGTLQHGDETYRVVDTASYRTAADAKPTQSSDIQQVGLLRYSSGNCSSCGTSSCGGSCGMLQMQTASCGSCGTACGGRCGSRQSGLSCQGALSNDPCTPCSPYRYASVEALYMQRDDVNFNFNRTLLLPDFDYEWGSRIVVGSVYDCVNGYEASLVGPMSWDASNRLAPNQALDPTFQVGAANTIRTNVSYENQAQSLDSDYFSIDTSKTINGWEIAKLLFGGRYVDYSEDYSYSGITRTEVSRFPGGVNPADLVTETTQNIGLRSEIENRMIGLQVGLDLLYPISRFAYSDLRLRAGAYANFAESNYIQLGSSTQQTTTGPVPVTDGTRSLNSRGGDDDVELAGMFEIGSGVRYQVGELLSLRAGVELWYLSGVATATTNVQRPNGPIAVDEDILFTGLSFGSELRW